MSVMRMEIKLSPQFISSIYFPFYTKIKTSTLLRVGIKNLPKKTCLIKPCLKWVFLNFLFLRYLKHFISIILIVIVLLNILPCNSRKISVYTYISYE